MGVQPRCTGADHGTWQQAATGHQCLSDHSMVPPNCCCSGPVAIAMLMSQHRQEALQGWNWHLALRRVGHISGFKKSGNSQSCSFLHHGGVQEAISPFPHLSHPLAWHDPDQHKERTFSLVQRAQKCCLVLSLRCDVPLSTTDDTEEVKVEASPSPCKRSPHNHSHPKN